MQRERGRERCGGGRKVPAELKRVGKLSISGHRRRRQSITHGMNFDKSSIGVVLTNRLNVLSVQRGNLDG